MVFLFRDAWQNYPPLPLKAAVGAIYAAALAALSLLLPSSPLRFTAIMILTYFSAKIYFSKGWLATLYPTILFFVFAILTDILCGMLLQSGGIPAGELMGSGTARLIYNILCKLFHLLCLYIILTITKAKSYTYSLLKGFAASLLPAPEHTSVSRTFLSLLRNGPDFLRFETLGLLYINLIMCASVETLNRSMSGNGEERTARQQLELQKNYYLDIMGVREETRRMWHDIRKYMSSMESLVANENREEAQKCLEQLQSAFFRYRQCGGYGKQSRSTAFLPTG